MNRNDDDYRLLLFDYLDSKMAEPESKNEFDGTRRSNTLDGLTFCRVSKCQMPTETKLENVDGTLYRIEMLLHEILYEIKDSTKTTRKENRKLSIRRRLPNTFRVITMRLEFSRIHILVLLLSFNLLRQLFTEYSCSAHDKSESVTATLLFRSCCSVESVEHAMAWVPEYCRSIRVRRAYG